MWQGSQRLWVVVGMLLLAVGGTARAVRGSTVELLSGSAPRPQGWATLAVHIHALEGDGAAVSVAVQDARGGAVMERSLTGGVDPSDEAVLLPLPYLLPADLPAGKWPVVLTTTFASGVRRSDRVTMTVPGEQSGETIVTASGTRVRAQGLATAGATVVEVPAPELLRAPALALAGVDAVLLAPEQVDSWTPERADELMAAGVRVMVPGATPPKGALSPLGWERQGEADLWVYPGERLARPALLEPGLRHVGSLQVTLSPPWWVRWTLMGALGGAVVIVVLARGMFRQAWVVLAASVVAVGGMTFGVAAYLRQNTPVEERSVAWTQSNAPHVERQSNSSAVTLRESFWTATPLLVADVEHAADGGVLLTPVAVDAASYFAWRGVTLSLGVRGEGGGGMPNVLRARVPAGETVACKVREAAHTRTVLPFPESEDARARWGELTQGATGAAGWLEAGYLVPAGHGGVKVLFTDWAKGTPFRDSALAWYELRYDGRERYWVSADGDDPAAVGIVDVGPVPPMTAP